MSNIHAGMLNERITFMTETLVSTGVGKKKQFSEGATVWANIRWVSDREKYRSNVIGQTIDIRVVIRAREVSKQNRVKYDGNVYEITAMRPLNKEWLELTLGAVNG